MSTTKELRDQAKDLGIAKYWTKNKTTLEAEIAAASVTGGSTVATAEGAVIAEQRHVDATPKAKPAKKAAAKKAKASGEGTRGTRSFDPTGAEVHKCAGACGEELPISSFPTVHGGARRGAECRKCRDARRAK